MSGENNLELTYKGNESYLGLFQHLGSITMKHGNRIIWNRNYKNNSRWIAVLCSSLPGEIYVCEGSTNAIQPKWPQRWSGKKYVNFKLQYQGEFYDLMKHTNKNKAKQYWEEPNRGLLTFQGHFKFNKKHTNNEDKDRAEVRNGQKIIEKIEGAWVNGNRQGTFTVKKTSETRGKFRAMEEIQVRQYHNDICIQSGTTTNKRNNNPFLDLYDSLNIGVTSEGVMSLGTNKCLFSEMVDLFFKRLTVSFNKQTRRSSNMKAFTVFMFEKLVPSGKVSDQTRQNVSIRYNAFESTGYVYRNLTSIFEVNPLLLFPLNRDQSHFALGAIQTKITRNPNNNALVKVQFNIIYLDSLYMQQENVLVILSKYISEQIKSIHSEERAIYQKGLENAKFDFRQFKYNKQDNEVDCGVFTCLYGFLLTLESCSSNYTVSWQWNKKSTIIAELRETLKIDAEGRIHDFFDYVLKLTIAHKIVQEKENKYD